MFQIFDNNSLVNQYLGGLTSEQIISYVVDEAKNPVVSTSFGPNSAVLLQMVTGVYPDIPIIWVDSGFNTNSTYQFALQLIDRLKLNMKIYTPRSTSAFLNVKMKGIPDVETPAHEEFTDTVKLEPFNRALVELRPDVWFSGIRAEETEFRKTLNILTTQTTNLVKVAPILYWTEEDIYNYIKENNLPTENNYFDPTKSFEGAECGLHTRL